MALISMVPSTPASAMAARYIPEKKTEARIFKCPSSAFRHPTRDKAKWKIRLMTLAEFIKLPARMKKRTASNGKLSTLPTILWTGVSGVIISESHI
jgi:hypothetical protein